MKFTELYRTVHFNNAEHYKNLKRGFYTILKYLKINDILVKNIL